MLEWLGFAYSIKGRALNIFYKNVNAFNHFLVSVLPLKIVFPCMIGENEIHSVSILGEPPPFSN